MIPVVLSGGSGSRLWPLSRQQYPKQFLSLTDERSLLQDTLERVKGLNYSQNIVICNEEHRFLVAEQLRESNFLQTSSIILEPTGKNTAPAIALAAFNLLAEGNDALLL
ncbi:TPA: sugar phosphate nucleotidyltransferase, partial [Escherichia coli]